MVPNRDFFKRSYIEIPGDIMQLFIMDATILKKIKIEICFAHENIKKNSLKNSLLMAVWIFFSVAPIDCLKQPELKIHIRNVAQDTSVYYTSPSEKCVPYVRHDKPQLVYFLPHFLPQPILYIGYYCRQFMY